MPQLQALKSAASLKELSVLLEFKPSAVAYILYKMPVDTRYRSFVIPKRNGGVRQINAPCPELMLLQRRVCDLLQNCAAEINTLHGWEDQLAHGFKRERSIVTNARKHRARRFVFNIDIEDFFASINFGRVRGFLIKSNDFALQPPVATIIAQIACHENALPQGSPCSPVISNLIGSILDVRLCKLASDCGCTYSRYADDITFSTNKQDFPAEIAKASEEEQHHWEVGNRLRSLMTQSGFAVNDSKTRMQYRTSRQDVTGLVVNRKVNIRSEYRRTVRAMANRLLKTGHYEHIQSVTQQDGVPASINSEGTLDQLHGMLGHIWGVDIHNWRVRSGLKAKDPIENASEEDMELLHSKERLYRRFLIYRNVFVAQVPTIICEGKTDNIYLLHAIRRLAGAYPTLASIVENQVKVKVRIFKYPQTNTGRIMGLTGGTGSFQHFIPAYAKELRRLTAPGMQYPVILLMDRDGGASHVLNMLKNQFKKNIDADQPFIRACGNLYVVTTPLVAEKKSSLIEDCFDEETKAHEIDGKKFKIDKAHGENEHFYGKHIFAKYVEAHAATIDFSGFSELLSRLSATIESHKNSLEIPDVDQGPLLTPAKAAAG